MTRQCAWQYCQVPRAMVVARRVATCWSARLPRQLPRAAPCGERCGPAESGRLSTRCSFQPCPASSGWRAPHVLISSWATPWAGGPLRPGTGPGCDGWRVSRPVRRDQMLRSRLPSGMSQNVCTRPVECMLVYRFATEDSIAPVRTAVRSANPGPFDVLAAATF
jgi:hypothetical protein